MPKPVLRPLSSLVLVFAASVTACTQPGSPPQQPRPATPPRPAPPPPAPPPPADWRDWPVSAGTWTYGRDGRGTRAMFGEPGRDARLVLRCDAAERRLYLSRSGSGVAPLAIRTTSLARTLAVQSTGGALPYVAAALAPDDRLLDAMAFSRGRFVIEQAGEAALVVPAWAEIGRVTEDCRN